MLEVRALAAGKPPILHEVSLCVRSGEFVGILGRNGSGKTTLLRSVAGGIVPSAGEILWKNRSLTALSVRERAKITAYLPQNPASCPGMSALDYLETGLLPARGLFFRRTAEDERRIGELAEVYGMTEFLRRTLDTLSGGERQRLSLLRAELRNTPVLLLDEPSGPLDFDASHALFRRLRDLCRGGKTALTVLHDPTAALAYCDRILLLEGGCILGELDPADSAETLEAGLRKLYPGLRIAEQNGVRFCF